MTDEEGFLARWSRRKRASAGKPPAPPEGGKRDGAAAPAPPPEAGREAAAPPAPDELPPVDAIGAETDIRAFLAPNVPTELARAALRRTWSSDPAIRDFIGLSENAWDFTRPDGVPGFGSLSGEQASRLLELATGDTKAPAAIDPSAGSVAGSGEPDLPQIAEREPSASPSPSPASTAVPPEDAAAQRKNEAAALPAVEPHAKPPPRNP